MRHGHLGVSLLGVWRNSCLWQGRHRPLLGDLRRLREGVELDEKLTEQIRLTIRHGATPRHVPAVVVAVDDLPRTRSGKIAEIAVREIVHGRSVNNHSALANPETLQLFDGLVELR